jgi:HD-like signal output (HDOD) protein
MLSWLKRKKQNPKKALRAALGAYELPTFPAIILEAAADLRRPNAVLRSVSRKLAMDPGVSSKLLGITNSAAYALKREVRSVDHAVALLGRSEVESLLLGVGVARTLNKTRSPHHDMGQFWRTAALRAILAREFARVLHPATSSECFTSALLQDMAIPLLFQTHGSSYADLTRQAYDDTGGLTTLESQALGCSHAHIAGWLCEDWGFPSSLTEHIGAHHDESQGVLPAVRLTSRLDERDIEAAFDRLVEEAREHGLPPDRTTALVAAAREQADGLARQLDVARPRKLTETAIRGAAASSLPRGPRDR